MKKFFGFFGNVKNEMKQVTWPTAREMTHATLVVIVTVALAAGFFVLVDLGINSLLKVFL